MNSTDKENLVKLAKIVYYFQKKRYEREPSLHHLEEVKKAKTDRSVLLSADNKDVLAEHQYKMIKEAFALSRYFLQCNVENQLKSTVFCYKKCK